ncbi:MAG: helix-turn-helix transcriptional regulator [Deltaproteobacteria bacterium]|nr:helix-turn-helix transcriptional regulator [Deltaproteobacteria bacterium]
MLAKLVLESMNEKNLSMRAAAREAGVAHTTFGRILKGENVDISTLNAVCDWIGVNVSDVMDDNAGQSSLSQRIAMVVSKEPALGRVFDEMLTGFENGDIDSRDIEDIVNYAGYRLNLKNIGKGS